MDTTNAGPGELTLQVLDERRAPIPTQISREQEAVVRVAYTPRSVGTFSVVVGFGVAGGQPVPGSPFSVKVQPDIDVGKIIVDGVEQSVLPGCFSRSILTREFLNALILIMYFSILLKCYISFVFIFLRILLKCACIFEM